MSETNIGIIKNSANNLFTRYQQVCAFIRKDFQIQITYKLQFAFQFLQVFFSIAVIYFIGKMIDQSGGSSLLERYGSDYFSFALVGLAVTSYCRAGLVNTTNDIRQTMAQGTLEAMFATPVTYVWMLFCSSFWQFLFETIRITFYFLTGMLIFGMQLENTNWTGAAVIAFLTIPLFLMLGMTSCSILILVKRGDPINWIFSSVAALLAGTMFPVSVLPYWLRILAQCMPLTHSLEAMRRCLLTGASISDVSRSILILLVFNIILLPLTVTISTFCLLKAKRCGALSTH